jgi:Cell Wall Hydrolase
LDLSGDDRDNVTRTIMAEVGENATPASMAAIASVIRNRLAAGGYGASPSAIVHAPNQFEPWNPRLRGQAVMSFATATSGTLHFKQAPTVPAAVRDPPFMNYAQTYDPVGLRLVVTFSIVFPDDCTLPVVAVFDAA